MSGPQHTYEVSLDASTEGVQKKEDVNGEGGVRAQTQVGEDGKVTVSVPIQNTPDLTASQDAVSSAYASAIEEAVRGDSDPTPPSTLTQSGGEGEGVGGEGGVGGVSTIDRIAEALSRLEKENAKLEKENNLLKVDVESVTASLVQERKNARKNQERATDAEAQARTLQEEVGALRAQIAADAAATRQVTTTSEAAQREISTLQERLRSATQEVEFFKKTFQEMEALNAKNVQQIAAMVDDIALHGTRLRNQEQRVHEYQVREARLLQQIEQLSVGVGAPAPTTTTPAPTPTHTQNQTTQTAATKPPLKERKFFLRFSGLLLAGGVAAAAAHHIYKIRTGA